MFPDGAGGRCASKQTRPMFAFSLFWHFLSQSRFRIIFRTQMISYETQSTGKRQHCVRQLFGGERVHWTSVLPSLISERQEVMMTQSQNMFQENESSVFRDPDLDALYSFLFPPLLFLEHHSVYARNSKRINHTTLFCSVLSVISRTKDMICVRIFISVCQE